MRRYSLDEILSLSNNRKNHAKLKYNFKNRKNLSEIKLVLSCHKHNLEPILTDYIYPISYINAKKANPLEEFALIKKR